MFTLLCVALHLCALRVRHRVLTFTRKYLWSRFYLMLQFLEKVLDDCDLCAALYSEL